MSDPLRESVRAAMYSAVDETLDALWPFLGIPEVDPVEAKAQELWEVGNPGSVARWSHVSEAIRDVYLRMARHVLGQEDRP